VMAQLPGNELHEVGVERDASISVEDAAVLGGDEVRGHDLLVSVHDEAFHRAISRLLHRLLDVIQCSLHTTHSYVQLISTTVVYTTHILTCS
jgi:hypothetical protein